MTVNLHMTAFGGLLRKLLTVLCLAGSIGVAHADDAQISEYRVKTAFLYNFARFITWPESALQDRTEFTLCIIGTDPFGVQLDKLTGKTVHAHTLVVRRILNIGDVHDCHLVYISEDADHAEVLSVVRSIPVLTVSDAGNFIDQGGIIQFVLVHSKVRFKINVAAASKAGLSVSSKLLSLATSVSGR